MSLTIRFKIGDTTHDPGNVELPNERLGETVEATAFAPVAPSTYDWTLLDKPEGSETVLSNPLAAKPTFTPDLDGTYLLRLIANKGMVGERRAMAYVGFYTYYLETRVPAAGETTEEGARGWAAEVGAGLRKLVNVSGRGAVLLCANGAGELIAPGTAVLLADMPAGALKPRVVKATRELLAAADPALAVVGIALGDPVYRKAVDPDADVAVSFGPGVATGLTISGDEPESYPAPVTLGDQPGELAFGDTPTVAHSFNSGVAVLAPPRAIGAQEGFTVLTGDAAITTADLATGKIILADANAANLSGLKLAASLPTIPEGAFAKTRIVSLNGDTLLSTPDETATINGTREIILTDREAIELAYYNGDWLLIGGTMQTVNLGNESVEAIATAMNPLANHMLAATTEIKRLTLMLAAESGLELPDFEDLADAQDVPDSP